MKIKAVSGVKKTDIAGFAGVLVFKDRENPWSMLLREENFEGNFKDELLTAEKNTKLFFIGLGDSREFSLGKLSQVIAFFAKKCDSYKKRKVSLVIPKTSFSDVELGKNIIESLNLGLYKFAKYKTEKKEFIIDELIVHIDGFTDSRIKSFNRGIEEGNLFSIAVNYCRDLVNEPPNVTTPQYLASEAMKLEKGNSDIEVEILDAKKMQKLQMEASLAIGKGSSEEPRFIKIEYKPRKPTKKIVIVGKGLCFDSGGLSLKTSTSMETMKIDMAGAAIVLSVFKIIEKLDLRVHAIGLISAVENMPSGAAVKPGDVVRAFNGKTIEILNTDAEGRVTMADSLSYGASLKPNEIIDVATLTGACVVALGEEITGMMGSDKGLINRVAAAAERESEMVWQLPLEVRYKEMLKSDVADLKNTAKKYGGAITAGLFLQEFVDNVPWVHLDIAGPAWAEKGEDLVPKGATGAMVKTILRFLMNE